MERFIRKKSRKRLSAKGAQVWKIFFEYSDKSKCTLTGKHKDIPLRLAVEYQNRYGVHACKSTYQQYPKKDHEPVDLYEKIEQSKESGVSE